MGRLSAQEEIRRRVGLPPEDLNVVGVGVGHVEVLRDERWKGQLGRHDTALMIDAHERTEGDVEDGPTGAEDIEPSFRGWQTDACQQKRDGWKQEPRLLVRNYAKK